MIREANAPITDTTARKEQLGKGDWVCMRDIASEVYPNLNEEEFNSVMDTLESLMRRTLPALEQQGMATYWVGSGAEALRLMRARQTGKDGELATRYRIFGKEGNAHVWKNRTSFQEIYAHINNLDPQELSQLSPQTQALAKKNTVMDMDLKTGYLPGQQVDGRVPHLSDCDKVLGDTFSEAADDYCRNEAYICDPEEMVDERRTFHAQREDGIEIYCSAGPIPTNRHKQNAAIEIHSPNSSNPLMVTHWGSLPSTLVGAMADKRSNSPRVSTLESVSAQIREIDGQIYVNMGDLDKYIAVLNEPISYGINSIGNASPEVEVVERTNRKLSLQRPVVKDIAAVMDTFYSSQARERIRRVYTKARQDGLDINSPNYLLILQEALVQAANDPILYLTTSAVTGEYKVMMKSLPPEYIMNMLFSDGMTHTMIPRLNKSGGYEILPLYLRTVQGLTKQREEYHQTDNYGLRVFHDAAKMEYMRMGDDAHNVNPLEFDDIVRLLSGQELTKPIDFENVLYEDSYFDKTILPVMQEMFGRFKPSAVQRYYQAIEQFPPNRERVTAEPYHYKHKFDDFALEVKDTWNEARALTKKGVIISADHLPCNMAYAWLKNMGLFSAFGADKTVLTPKFVADSILDKSWTDFEASYPQENESLRLMGIKHAYNTLVNQSPRDMVNAKLCLTRALKYVDEVGPKYFPNVKALVRANQGYEFIFGKTHADYKFRVPNEYLSLIHGTLEHVHSLDEILSV